MNQKNSHILIVDDDADLLATMCDSLKLKGFEPVCAQTGVAALAALEDHDFVVALIDLHLTDGSGLDLLSSIKSRTSETECILLTGYASQDSAIKAVQMNAFGYFQKPVDMEQLLLSIQRAVEKRQTARALRESEARYRAVIQSAPDAIVSVDSMGNIIDWNPSAERIFGYAASEVDHRPLMLLLPARHQEKHLAGMARVLTGGEKHIIGTTVEMEGLRKDGSEFPLELSLAELYLGEEKIFTAIIRDITERKWAQGMQKKHARILGKRFKELNCLYSISEIVRRSDISREEILQESAYMLAHAYQFPEISVCRLTLGDEVYRTDNFARTGWLQEQPIMIKGKQAGLIEVCYLEEKPLENEGPFLFEERKIIKTVADILGRFIEHG